MCRFIKWREMGRYFRDNPYIPHSDSDLEEMLRSIGVSSLDELFSDIPAEFRSFEAPPFEGPMSERDMKEHIWRISSRNKSARELGIHVGQGIYPRYTPAIVSEVISRGEFLTSYTPYQAEASQGVLTALFEYQSLMAELLEMDVVNSSMYDWSTALAEAGRMAMRLTGRRRVLVARYCFWERVEVLRTYLDPIGGAVEEVPFNRLGELELRDRLRDDVAALYVENPTSLGFIVENLEDVAESVHRAGGLLIMGVEPTSLGLLRPPGSVGADIAVGEGQSLGLPMSLGGPALGILATRGDPQFIRSMPGRLIGMAETAESRERCFTMILQTREQHIRREKATSNICTNQTLLAIGAAVYLSLLGREGMRRLAEYIFALTQLAMEEVGSVRGVEIPFGELPHYQEFAYRLGRGRAREILSFLLERGVMGGVPIAERFPELGESIVTCFTEIHRAEDARRYAELLREALGGRGD